jgi:hypothetical protein
MHLINHRFTYLYVPNNTLGAKYENMSEIAILLSLLNNKVKKKKTMFIIMYRLRIKTS